MWTICLVYNKIREEQNWRVQGMCNISDYTDLQFWLQVVVSKWAVDDAVAICSKYTITEKALIRFRLSGALNL